MWKNKLGLDGKEYFIIDIQKSLFRHPKIIIWKTDIEKSKIFCSVFYIKYVH